MFDDVIELTRWAMTQGMGSVPNAAWRPAADVYRTPTGWLVKLELAGVRPEHVRVHISGRSIAIEGKRVDSSRYCSGGQCHALEITYSHFRRLLELPHEIERAGIKTHYEDGMFIIQIDTEQIDTEEPGA